jgi:hypothetical protein
LSLENYELDPLHFVTSTSLAWTAYLNYTDVVLELLAGLDMHLFVENYIVWGGGITQISCRYAKANNKYMGSQYDVSLPSSYLIYLDCVNVYGACLHRHLPVGLFRELDDDEIRLLDITKKNVDAESRPRI